LLEHVTSLCDLAYCQKFRFFKRVIC